MNEFRTAFFVPGGNEKMLSKAGDIDADLLIFDLEDSVRESQKPLARTLVKQTLQSEDLQSKICGVRVNALDSGHTMADLESVMVAKPALIVLPKTESGAQLRELSEMLAHFERELELEFGATKIIALTAETPASLFAYDSIENVSERLVALTWGPEDLATELGAEVNRNEYGEFLPPFELVRTLCLAKARALGIQPIDTVFADIKDLAGLKKECASAKQIGYTGKLAIHPAQVEIINETFTPSAQEIEKAQAVIDLFEANPDSGTFQFEGKMVDIPHIKMARRILVRAGVKK